MSIDVLDNDDFEFALHDASMRRAEPRFTLGTFCVGLVTILVATVAASATFWSPPVWLQPSVLGLLWGGVFLNGVATGYGRGSLLFTILALSHLCLTRTAFEHLTSLATSECCILCVILFASGWVTAQFDSMHSAVCERRVNREQSANRDSIRILDTSDEQPTIHSHLRQQWTIWDLAVLTTLCAVLCYAIPHVTSSLLFLSHVLFAATAGSLASWIAYRWVLDDRWSLGKLAVLVIGTSLGLWLIVRQTPDDFSMLHALVWILTGPLAVIAAQAFTVMAILTAIRIDNGSLLPSTQQS